MKKQHKDNNKMIKERKRSKMKHNKPLKNRNVNKDSLFTGNLRKHTYKDKAKTTILTRTRT